MKKTRLWLIAAVVVLLCGFVVWLVRWAGGPQPKSEEGYVKVKEEVLFLYVEVVSERFRNAREHVLKKEYRQAAGQIIRSRFPLPLPDRLAGKRTGLYADRRRAEHV